MKKSKRLLSLILCVMLVVSCFTIMSTSTAYAAGNSKYSSEEVILHCWNWPVSTIRAKLSEIANSGYTAIQTSPINGIVGSGSNSADNTVENWYQFYQPKNYSIGNKICTQSEFESLCSEAHALGLKVIVDVALNHTTDQTSQVSGITQDYHGYGDISDWDDRWQQTQKDITGMPDLNTSNTTLQSQAKTMLQNILKAGADGFRFDAAKHIELPSGYEISGCPTSNYWPNVLNGLGDKFTYGEVLAGQNCPLTGYANYMNITGSAYSDTVRNNMTNNILPASDLTDYKAGLGGNNLVCWVESHDNYKGGTYQMPKYQVSRAWAAITAQGLNTIYLARPYGSSTSNWKGSDNTYDGGNGDYFDSEVVGVNKFHNVCKGAGVNVYNYNNNNQLLVIERGNKGICFINTGASTINVSVSTSMSNNTYKDLAHNSSFTVSNGYLSGSVAPGVYPVASSSSGTVTPTSTTSSAGRYTVKFTNNQNWSNVYLYAWNSSGSNATWPGVQLTDKSTNDYGEVQYTANIEDKYTSIIFSDGNGTQTVDITNTTRDGSITGYYPSSQSNGKWNVGTWTVQGASTAAATTAAPTTVAPTTAAPTTAAPTTQEPTETPTTTPATVTPTTAAPTTAAPTTAAPTNAPGGKYTVKFTNNKSWSNVYLYAWNNSSGAKNASWPGVQLTSKTTNTYGEEQYTATVDDTYDRIIFNNGSGTQTVDITHTSRDGSVIGYYLDSQTNGKWNVGTWTDQAATTAVPTQAPTTAAPTTAAPTTAVPTTQEPTEAPTTAAPTEAEGTEYTINLNTNGIAAFSGGNIYCNAFNSSLDVVDSDTLVTKMTETDTANLYSATFKTNCKYIAFTCYASGTGISVDIPLTGSKTYSIMDTTTTDASGTTRYQVVEGMEGLPTYPTSEPIYTTAEPTTAEPTTAEPTTPDKDKYEDSKGNIIDLTEEVSRESDDTTLTGIDNSFKNLQVLGVQKKSDNTKHSIRFVSVLNNNIVNDAQDYGYIVAGATSMDKARSVVESYTLDTAPSRHVFSCKNSSNRISGNYGNKDADTKYKYVTFAVNNIGDNAVAAVFYVKDSKGNVYYAPYTNKSGDTYNSCSANWAALGD